MKKNKTRTVSILLPVYNEEKTITQLLNQLAKLHLDGIQIEMIVVNDCSADKTLERIQSFQRSHKNITLISHEKNLGKGAALKTALTHATGSIYIIQDADLEYPPLNIPVLLKPILEKQTLVVYGSRKLNKKNKYSSFVYFIGGAFINILIKTFLKRNITDSITGAKAISAQVMKKIGPIESKGFEIDAELTRKIVKAGYDIQEVPIIYHPRTHQEGKKIRWYHTFRIFWTLLK